MAGSPGGSGGKKLPARDTGSISGSQQPLEKEMSTHSCVLAWKIPWTGAWWATVQGVAEESHGPQGLNNHNIRWNCELID